MLSSSGSIFNQSGQVPDQIIIPEENGIEEPDNAIFSEILEIPKDSPNPM